MTPKKVCRINDIPQLLISWSEYEPRHEFRFRLCACSKLIYGEP
jgi:hypothetical protein